MVKPPGCTDRSTCQKIASPFSHITSMATWGRPNFFELHPNHVMTDMRGRVPGSVPNHSSPPSPLYTVTLLTTLLAAWLFNNTAHKNATHKVSEPRVILTLVLATYMPVEFSLCFICCALYTCRRSLPPNSTSVSCWLCSKKSMGKVTWLDVRAAVGTVPDCRRALLCSLSTSALPSKLKTEPLLAHSAL